MLTGLVTLAFLVGLGAEPGAAAGSPLHPSRKEDPSGEAGILPDNAHDGAYFRGTRVCYGFRLGQHDATQWKFSVLGEDGTSLERQVVVTGVEAEQELWEQCGPEARKFAEVTLATCDHGESLARLLQDPSLIHYRPPPLPPEVAATRLPIERNFFSIADDIGCARAVSSRDGRVRLWIPAFERVNEETEQIERGKACLQSLGPDGAVRVHVLDKDSPLHFDTVVDFVEPLPGKPGRYLVLGVRSYLTTFAGGLPRRYAIVVDIRDDGPHLVAGMFSLGDKRRDVLLLGAAAPETGKFRHSPLAAHYLEYVPSNRTIRLADFDLPPSGVRKYWYPGPYPRNRLVARWVNGHFQIQATSWGAIGLTKTWGTR